MFVWQLMGMAFFGVGIFLRVGAETIMSHVDELMEQVPDIAGGVDMAGVTVPTYLRVNLIYNSRNNDDIVDLLFRTCMFKLRNA